MLCPTFLCEGASIKYVRTEGEGGSKKPENMRTIVLIGCVKSVQEGGEGVKKAGKSAYVLNGCSLKASIIQVPFEMERS